MPKSSFNFQEFKKLKTQSGVYQYALEHLGRPKNCGISRCMWKISVDGKELALKVNEQNNDTSQTEQEVHAASCVKDNDNFVKMIAHSPLYLWDIMELAQTPLDKKLFQNYTGIEWNKFEKVALDYGIHAFEDTFMNNKWAMNLLDGLRKCGMTLDDLHDQNWGQINGRPVILDYGI